MAISTSYVLRETAGNLRRNLFMTLAAILTMAVSLIAVGAGLVLRQGINQASVQWRGGVQMSIFLSPNVSQTETDAIGKELKSTPGVKNSHFVNKVEAYQEFKTIFGGNSNIVGVLTVADMPPSFRVVPTRAQDIAELGRQFQGQPGVLKVSYAEQEIDTLLKQFNTWKVVFTVVFLLVLVGAIALIVNTIQLAIYARRREVAVMKLVGATNWFIRVPFMLEGLMHGLLGAIAAFLFTYFARNSIVSLLPDQTILGTNQLYVAPHSAIMSGLVLLLIGALVGVFGSAFSVRRYLAV